MTDTAIDPEDREFLIWLRSVEKRAILPLKWAIFATTLVFWMLSRPGGWPLPVDVFVLFTGYFMFNLLLSYLYWFSRIELQQVRPVAVFSYCVDVAFITLLVMLDIGKYPAPPGFATDFYVFYFLLILRGFALFRSPRANLMANSVIGAIFIGSLFWQDSRWEGYQTQANVIRIVFIWLVILMSWFIVEIINRQNMEIIRVRENLLQSENLAMIGQLAAGVAHEINNPIGIISAYAEYLKKQTPEDDPRAADLESIHKESQRCKRIVEELLTYARPSRHEIAAADLPALVDEVVQFVFRRNEAGGIEIVRNYTPGVPSLELDRDQFKQALLNVFLNARDAMGTSGTLTIDVGPDPERQGVRLRVSDSGMGMDSGAMRRAFDPFFTTRAKGTGLGLSITRRIVEAHGGTIELHSAKGQGTVVAIHLPAGRGVGVG